MKKVNKINDEIFQAKSKKTILFIHTPFCGTCHLARKMLETTEIMKKDCVFYEMNASLFPSFMQENKIHSVPCLLLIKDGEIADRVYAFESVTNIYNRISRCFP